ncbi:MAG: YybS family protein [Firmicutes bacterium]|jgi:uncharacterized protein YybS (DUF2232 family)|nr:YybS family protein [Bacillota bacterium]
MQQRVSPKPLVEGALLAAVAVVLALIGFYVPLVGVVVVFLWPVPVALVHLRHGLRVSVLTVVVAGLVLTTFVGPLEAVGMVVTFGFAGLALGVCFDRKVSPSFTVLVGAVAALASSAVGMLISFIFLKVSPVQMMTEMVEAFQQANNAVGNSSFMQWMQGLGLVRGEQLEETRKIWDTTMQAMRMLFPAVFGCSALLISVLNFETARAVLTRLGYRVEPLPPFETWRLPTSAALGIIVGILSNAFQSDPRWHWVYIAGMNVQTVTSMLFLVHGAALAYWFMANRWRFSKPMRICVLVLAFFQPFLGQVLVLFGILDSVFDWRGLGFGFRR